MKTLLLLRHAKSSWDHPRLADHDRQLNDRGRQAAPRIGAHLREHDLIPDVILCSSAARARQTVDGLLEELPFEGEVLVQRKLYAASVEAYAEALGALDDGLACALLVAHNPEMEEALSVFCGVNERMPTGALAHLQFEAPTWRAAVRGEARLVDVWRPRDPD